MVRLISTALLVTIHCMLLHGSKRIVKLVHKPYGPKMCKELCADSTGYFMYVKEDLSCHVVPPSSFSIITNCTSGSFTCIKKDRMSNGSLALTSTVRNECCHTRSKGKEMSDVLKLIVNKANATHGYNEALHKACKKGNLCLVQYILSHKLADINCRETSGRTPVMVAARTRQASVFDFLVRHGCDLSVMDRSKNSVLHIACKGGDISIVRKLVHIDNCDTESKGYRKWTPVMTAACYGNEKVFQFLVSLGCNLTTVDVENYNILHLACEGGKTGIVNYILENNISDIESKAIHGRTPAMIAAQNGREDVFRLLVSKGCDLSAVDKQNSTILHVACLEDNADMVKYLLSQNITSIESRGYDGRTPFMSAAEKGRLRVAKLLVEKGCNITAVDEDQNNAIHVACIGDNAAMMKYLLSLNISSIESRGLHGRTPFLVAAQKGNMRVVKLLIEKGCNVTAVDIYQCTALHLASMGGHVDIVTYLSRLEIFNGKEENKYGETPIEMAELRGRVHVVAYLKVTFP